MNEISESCVFSFGVLFSLSSLPSFIGISRSVQMFIFSIGTKMSGCPRLYLGTGDGVDIFQKFMRDLALKPGAAH